MGRPRRCRGCKELKFAHDFGRPGKNCTGPVRNDTEQDLETVDELEHTEEVGATASPKPDVLQSLTESVQLLSTELKSLRQETTHPLQEKSPTSSSSAPVLFCRDYQRKQCIIIKDHFSFIRGERKWLKHICAACWTRLRKQESHRENSSDCPLKALAAKDSPVTPKSRQFFVS